MEKKNKTTLKAILCVISLLILLAVLYFGNTGKLQSAKYAYVKQNISNVENTSNNMKSIEKENVANLVQQNVETNLTQSSNGNLTEVANLAESAPTHDHSTWTALTADGTLVAGDYVLNGDLTLTSNITISTGTVNLCLNGYKLTGTGTGSVITINSGTTLNLYDCQASSTNDEHQHQYYVDDEGKFVYKKDASDTAWETEYNDATATKGETKGGIITGGLAHNGGGFYNNGGFFNMYGGSISGNTAINGGGVYLANNCTFTMNGGNIEGNTATNGGGVYLANNCTFTMNGGNIEGNKAKNGGGVYNGITFTMSGGTISGNTATDNGGGVSHNSTTFNLSGTAKITGNVKGGNIANGTLTGGTANNVYLLKYRAITAGPFTVGSTSGVTLANDYGDVAFTRGFGENNPDVTDPNTIFKLDNGKAVVLVDSEVKATAAKPNHTHDGKTFTEWTDTTSLPTLAGNYYLSANVTISSTWEVPTGATNLCLNGKTITMTGDNSVIKNPQNVSLTIYDEAENAGKITGGKVTSEYGSGGGIKNEGTLTINGGQITGNSAAFGCEISNAGTATINDCQFTGNSASDSAIDNGRIDDNRPGKLTINGGVFKNAVPDKLRTMISSSMGSTLKITGGTFDNKDNKFDVYANTFNASFSNDVLLSVFVTYPIQIDGKLSAGSMLTITYNEEYKADAPIWEIAKGKDYIITAEDFAKFSITNSKLFLRHDSVTPNGRILVILGNITIPTNSFGVTTLSIGGQNVTSASKGEKVKIITTPNSGKELDKIEVLKDDGDFTTKVTVDENNEFTMPEYKVIVSVTYKNSEEKPDDGTDYIKDVSSKTFKIKTERGLEKFTQEVNAGDNFENWTVTLENNIVLTKESSTPIGTDSTVFKGTFDGKKNTISNLQIDNASSDYQGLFRALAQGGTIKNLGIVNSTIKGKDNVGAIVAYNSGRVENCYSNGAVSGTNTVGGIVGYNSDGLIVDSCNEGIITGTNDSVGGIVGYHKKTAVNDSIIINCYNKGKITGYSNVGGIVGTKTTANITLDTYDLGNCFNNAVVTGVENVGGIAGSSALRIGNCYNSGNVTGAVLTSGTNTAGGLVGKLESGSFNMIVNSYYLQTETVNKGLDAVGSVIGGNVHNKVRNCSTFGKDKKLVTAGTQGAEKKDAWWVLTDFTKGADLTATLNVGVGVILDNKDTILPTGYTVMTWKDTSDNPKLDLKDTPNGGTPPSGNTSGGSGMTITNYDIFWKGIDTQVRLTNTDPVVAENSTTNYTVPKYVLDNHKATNKTLTIKFAEGDITITKEMAGKVSYSQESYTYAELKALFDEKPVVTPNPTPTPVPTEPEVVRNNLCWLWILLVILAIGGGITIYVILKKKSEKDNDEEQNNSEENK